GRGEEIGLGAQAELRRELLGAPEAQANPDPGVAALERGAGLAERLGEGGGEHGEHAVLRRRESAGRPARSRGRRPGAVHRRERAREGGRERGRADRHAESRAEGRAGGERAGHGHAFPIMTSVDLITAYTSSPTRSPSRSAAARVITETSS